MKLLVCGGRDYTDEGTAFKVLDHVSKPVDTIISGAAKGADTIGSNWAKTRGKSLLEFPANWGAYGKSAGPIRNMQMLVEGSPDFVLAFPGGKGTEHMLSISEHEGIPTTRVIFVFGSNTHGIHGAGAAKWARTHYQAEQGVGIGHTGWAYALPTKHTPYETIRLNEIELWYTSFLDDIADSPNLYYLTPVGSGLAGYSLTEIAEATILKHGYPDNVVLAHTWGVYK